jgi:hypothetical protein
MLKRHYKIGDLVEKVGGDYTFDGEIRCIFTKRSGAVRFVVEDDRGVLHVFSDRVIRRRFSADSPPYPPQTRVWVDMGVGDPILAYTASSFRDEVYDGGWAVRVQADSGNRFTTSALNLEPWAGDDDEGGE